MGKEKLKQVKYVIKKIKNFKERMGIERVILFGSYGRGNFTKNSDIDLILVSKKFRKKYSQDRYKGLWIKWHTVFKIGHPVDFICYTPEEFEKEKKKIGIVSTALKEGVDI